MKDYANEYNVLVLAYVANVRTAELSVAEKLFPDGLPDVCCGGGVKRRQSFL